MTDNKPTMQLTIDLDDHTAVNHGQRLAVVYHPHALPAYVSPSVPLPTKVRLMAECRTNWQVQR